MTTAVVERWVETPLRRFVEDSQAVLALLLTPSGPETPGTSGPLTINSPPFKRVLPV